MRVRTGEAGLSAGVMSTAPASDASQTSRRRLLVLASRCILIGAVGAMGRCGTMSARLKAPAFRFSSASEFLALCTKYVYPSAGGSVSPHHCAAGGRLPPAIDLPGTLQTLSKRLYQAIVCTGATVPALNSQKPVHGGGFEWTLNQCVSSVVVSVVSVCGTLLARTRFVADRFNAS